MSTSIAIIILYNAEYNVLVSISIALKHCFRINVLRTVQNYTATLLLNVFFEISLKDIFHCLIKKQILSLSTHTISKSFSQIIKFGKVLAIVTGMLKKVIIVHKSIGFMKRAFTNNKK